MRYVYFGIALVVLVLLLMLSGSSRPRTAYACSAGPDFDPVVSSDLIVGGWIEGWRERPELSTLGELQAIELDLQVDRVFKGSVPAGLEVIDGASFVPRIGGWAGGSGACGSFDANPEGLYLIAGLVRAEDGRYRMNRLRTFYLGASPSGAFYEQAVARASRISPPVTGSGGLVDGR